MQVNGIKSYSFGAEFDRNTRDWLFVTRNSDRVDTTYLDRLLTENYRDRYIRTMDNDDGVTDIRIKPAKYPVHGIPDIVIYESEKGKPLSEIMPIVIANMEKISSQRDDWQKKYDSNPSNKI